MIPGYHNNQHIACLLPLERAAHMAPIEAVIAFLSILGMMRSEKSGLSLCSGSTPWIYSDGLSSVSRRAAGWSLN